MDTMHFRGPATAPVYHPSVHSTSCFCINHYLPTLYKLPCRQLMSQLLSQFKLH